MGNKERYVQIGVTALRAPTGEFLPAVPLYVRADSPTASEPPNMENIAEVFAEKFGQYISGKETAKRKEQSKNEHGEH